MKNDNEPETETPLTTQSEPAKDPNPMFVIMDKDGIMRVPDPKLAAYKYMHYMHNVVKVRTSLTEESGVYTVRANGDIMPAVFHPLTPEVA